MSGAVGIMSCVRCVMNSEVDRNLSLNSEGLCNHCLRYGRLVSSRVEQGVNRESALQGLILQIKASGKGKEYDCIIGVSGGVDSTYVAYLVKSLGLRPLAVHLDNGWNSELAVKNIQEVLERLDIDLYTHVLDWEEFRDLQLSFLRASTPDGEIPTDHAIFALLWRQAAQHGIKYVVTGMNFATEAISLPDWAYGHSDWRYINDVHHKFGRSRLDTYPRFSLAYLIYLNVFRRIRTVSILNYVQYDKRAAMQLLETQLGWRNYGGKHHESIYTRFYQGYVLPKKFGLDKRYAHLSDMINSAQMTRDEAMDELKKPTYALDLQQLDLEYVTKKLRLTPEEFAGIMSLPKKSFRDYRNSYRVVELLKRALNWMRGVGIYPK